jgi:hypothetical protein
MKNIAGLFGVAFLAFTPLAHADFSITYSLDGGVTTHTCIDNSNDDNSGGTDSCFSSLTSIGGGVSIQDMTGTSNSPGDTVANSSFQTSSTTEIRSTATATLDIWVSAMNFTSPVTPPEVEYDSSLTIIPTASRNTTVVSTSCIDQNNAISPGLPGGSFCGSPAGSLTDMLTQGGSTSASTNSSEFILSLSAPFALEQHIVVSLVAGSHVQVQTSQNLSTVPEPFSAVLLGTLLVGAGIFRRRQLRKV